MTAGSEDGDGGPTHKDPARAGNRLTLPGGRRAGIHTPRPRGLVAAADRAAAIGATTLQLFTDNPTTWRRRPEPPADTEAFRLRLDQLNLGPLAVHASYLVNLAGPDDDLFSRSIGLLRSELREAPAFGARFVNVHVGSHRRTSIKKGIERVVDGLEQVLDHEGGGADTPVLVLENGSGGGDSIGVHLPELASILESASRRGLDRRLGVCLDTAHLWGAGYDISRPSGVDDVLREFDRLIGLDRLRMVHLNDSESRLGSRHDRHTHLGAGEIGIAGLTRILTHPDLDGVAFYAETPGSEEGFDAVNVGRMADMAAGREPRPLPPLERGKSSRVESGAQRIEAA